MGAWTGFRRWCAWSGVGARRLAGSCPAGDETRRATGWGEHQSRRQTPSRRERSAGADDGPRPRWRCLALVLEAAGSGPQEVPRIDRVPSHVTPSLAIGGSVHSQSITSRTGNTSYSVLSAVGVSGDASPASLVVSCSPPPPGYDHALSQSRCRVRSGCGRGQGGASNWRCRSRLRAEARSGSKPGAIPRDGRVGQDTGGFRPSCTVSWGIRRDRADRSRDRLR